MRISKVTWIILGVVVFVAAFAVLYVMYSGQQRDQDTLKQKVAANQAALARLTTEKRNQQAQLAVLQDELAQRQSELAAANQALLEAQKGWPADVQSIEYDQTLFQIADGWDLQVQTLVAGEKQSKVVQGITFGTTTFTVLVTTPPIAATDPMDYQDKVYGVVDDILAYIDSLANQKEFATATIDVVSMTVPPALTLDQLDKGTGPAPTATITVTIYSYKGG